MNRDTIEIMGLTFAVTFDYDQDSLPSIDLTIGWDPDDGAWSYQTGDNCYTGGAYGYPIWAVTSIYRRQDSRAVARDLINQLDEGTW